MTPVPEVSVVMCTYNGAPTLLASVQSVLSQSDVDLELIVVNDGSTDESAQILESLALNDSRVHVLTKENKGLTLGLIRGCEMVRGKYIARQDTGDYSLEGRLRIQKQALDAGPELSFVSCWTELSGPAREFLSISKGSGRASAPTRIISENAEHGVIDGPSHHGSVMFRRDRYMESGGYRPQFYFGQDWDLWYRLGEIGKFQMIEKVLYQACVMPNSLSGSHRDEQQAISKLSHKMLLRRRRGLPEDDLLRQAHGIRPASSAKISASLKAKGLYFVGEQLRRNGDRRAGYYLLEALKTCPTFFKPWLRLGQLWLKTKR